MSSKPAWHDPAMISKDNEVASPSKAVLASSHKTLMPKSLSSSATKESHDINRTMKSETNSFDSTVDEPYDERRDSSVMRTSHEDDDATETIKSSTMIANKHMSVFIDTQLGFDSVDGLKGGEDFHENAEAAVTAILTPRRLDALSIYSDVSSTVSNVPSSLANVDDEITKKKVRLDLISDATKKKLELIRDKLHQPDEKFKDLLEAIKSPEDRATMDGGYINRRKNACGALQVLIADTRKRVRLCWTNGVLSALTSVILDCADEGVDFVLPEERQREDLMAARKRALVCLWNLAVPKENRLLIFHTPKLVQGLLEITTTDYGEARREACGILALLAKSVENRLLMAQIPGLMYSLIQVLEPASLQSERAKHVLSLSTSSGSALSENSSDTISSSIEGSDFSSLDEDDEVDEELEDDFDVQTHISADDDRDEFFSQGLFSHFTEQPTETLLSKSETIDPSFSEAEKSSFSTDVGSKDDASDDVGSIETVETNASCSYDEAADEELRMARKNSFAIILSLSKSKDNAFLFARDLAVTSTVLRVAAYETSECQGQAVRVIANLARHPLNWAILMERPNIIPILIQALHVNESESQKYACFALQNLTLEESLRKKVAHTDKLIKSICDVAANSTDLDVKLAAVSVLKNLSIEPSNLVLMTNTRNCIATLMQLAHGEDTTITEMIRFHACDCLAALSHWLGKIASSGYPQAASNRQAKDLPQSVLIPTLEVKTWNQWD